MAAALITFAMTIPGLATQRIAVQEVKARIGDWAPFWERYFKNHFYSDEKFAFARSGSELGGNWPNLSAAYARWKFRHYGLLPILVRTNDLRASLTSQTAHSVWKAGQQALEVGTSVPYASYHQFGTARMKQRMVIGLGPTFLRETAKDLQRYMIDCWKAAKAFGTMS